MKFFDHKRESMPQEELQQFQLERLQALLARLKRNVRRYRELIGDTQVEDLKGVSALPLTRPDDLVESLPYGMLALPLSEVVRLNSTVGPDGVPLVTGHTRNDLALWGRLVARQLAAAGVTAHDVIQICFGGGVFEKALGYMLGAETIGASVIPEGPFHIDYQLAMLQNYRTTVLITSPTNARELARWLSARRIDPQSLHLRSVILSRPVAAEECDALKAGLLAEIWSTFGVAEILDPGFCVQCEEARYHVNEDQFLVETREGELVVTTLCREAMPLLRYCTRVACVIRRDRCGCGRTGAIIEPGARLDGRLRVNETALYEAQMAGVLAQTGAHRGGSGSLRGHHAAARRPQARDPGRVPCAAGHRGGGQVYRAAADGAARPAQRGVRGA